MQCRLAVGPAADAISCSHLDLREYHPSKQHLPGSKKEANFDMLGCSPECNLTNFGRAWATSAKKIAVGGRRGTEDEGRREKGLAGVVGWTCPGLGRPGCIVGAGETGAALCFPSVSKDGRALVGGRRGGQEVVVEEEEEEEEEDTHTTGKSGDAEKASAILAVSSERS